MEEKLLQKLSKYLLKEGKINHLDEILNSETSLTLEENVFIFSTYIEELSQLRNYIRQFLLREVKTASRVIFKFRKKTKSEKLEEELRFSLEKELTKFRENSEFDFFIENSENSEVIESLRKTLFNPKGEKTILLLGPEGSGKSHTVKQLLKESNYMYIDLSNLHFKLSDSQSKRKLAELLSEYKIVVFDNLETIPPKTKRSRLVNYIRETRSKEGNTNIFISSVENKEDCEKKYPSFLGEEKNLFYLNSPSSDFSKEIIRKLLSIYYSELKITESAIFFLSFLLGGNLKVLINKLLKIFLFLDSFNYDINILDISSLKRILNDISLFSEKKQLINYENNSQLKAICDKKKFEIDKIKGKSKKRKTVFERDQIIYILNKKLHFSTLDISKILLKSISGINYSLNKIENKRKNKTFRNYFDYLTDIEV